MHIEGTSSSRSINGRNAASTCSTCSTEPWRSSSIGRIRSIEPPTQKYCVSGSIKGSKPQNSSSTRNIPQHTCPILSEYTKYLIFRSKMLYYTPRYVEPLCNVVRTMLNLCVVLWPELLRWVSFGVAIQSRKVTRVRVSCLKNRHGRWVCWMSIERKNTTQYDVVMKYPDSDAPSI